MFEKVKTNLKNFKENNRQRKIKEIENKLFDEYYSVYSYTRHTLFDSYNIKNLDESQMELLGKSVKKAYRNAIEAKLPEIAEKELREASLNAGLKFCLYGLCACGAVAVGKALGVADVFSAIVAMGICGLGVAFASKDLRDVQMIKDEEISETFRYSNSYADDTETFAQIAAKKYERERAIKENLQNKDDNLSM